jgi:hypothetical protein
VQSAQRVAIPHTTVAAYLMRELNMLVGTVVSMTSDSDDLEQQLRENLKSRRELGDLEEQLAQNLKLRRELGAKVAKARDRNAKDRLGWAIYWTFLALGGIWVIIWLWMLHGGFFGLENTGVERAIEAFMRNPPGQLAFMGIPALMLYSLGRAIRYLLSGE